MNKFGSLIVLARGPSFTVSFVGARLKNICVNPFSVPWYIVVVDCSNTRHTKFTGRTTCSAKILKDRE